MAQLIKLQDYISRYEIDLYKYPSHFVRLKKQHWEKTKEQWELNRLDTIEEDTLEELDEDFVQEGVLHKIKSILKRSKEEDVEEELDMKEQEEDSLFNVENLYDVQHIDELKRKFLDQLFHFQVKWASSTILEKSYIDFNYFHDERLKFFLQRFPDSFMVLYQPILRLKNAPMELDIILLTPTEAWCLTFLEEEDQAVYIGSAERFWIKRYGEKEAKVLSPMLSLNRMEIVMKQLFLQQEVDFPIRKAVISRNGFIDYPNAPFDLEVIDERRFEEWFTRLRSMSSPLKRMQLKAAKSLLDVGQTTSFRRPEWEEDDAFLSKVEDSD
ncbi:NERD domain-containing protein [Bacillus sp. REN10]|uniref:NERD domain-containing protein n=1 Tax=Bacillus sp. REN10 TaxID=2782541 RepID=UPI00193C070D|nr:NERD domain-containing protein [Bacillus sp. REN10]